MKNSIDRSGSKSEVGQSDQGKAEARAALLAHDLAVARDEHDGDEEKWRQQPVNDGGPEKRFHWIDIHEVERGRKDDAVESTRAFEFCVEVLAPTERLEIGIPSSSSK